jgi:TorA maturation chaperone TorD
MQTTTEQEWLNRAALYEILAMGFLATSHQLAEALASGEYAEAMGEITAANGLNDRAVIEAVNRLTAYFDGTSAEDLFHVLRVEYTFLFVGAPEPTVSPYAGVWWAREAGVEALLFVNKESMAVERFMRSCGIGQPEGTNEPLDHIGTELEFLQYLCMLAAGVAEPDALVEKPEGGWPAVYNRFVEEHVQTWMPKFGIAVAQHTHEPFYRATADLLLKVLAKVS